MDRNSKTVWLQRDVVQHNSHDYFAVLGLPVTADAYQIRQRYLSLAKTLHPDVPVEVPRNKDKACEYLAKLVNPAYDNLMQARERAEYNALIKIIARRLLKRLVVLVPKSEAAKRLFRSPSDAHYVQAVEAIASLQYKSLDKVSEYTEQLSELNVVYALYQEGFHPALCDSSEASSQDSSKQQVCLSLGHINQLATHRAKEFSNPLLPRSQAYIRSAEAYIIAKQWTMALGDLRTALQIDRTNSKCHALLGVVYLNQRLLGMARLSFQQALKLNPREPLVQEHISQYAKMLSHVPNRYQKGSGFFGWLGSS
ncbi:J domain-containing protein [Pseudanabaena sp. PCC 6802]|uniref:J domain-containing protein n=1 Tax=Pseudanabaena sp. PCC 6802 TaxID=118173 RepID=UPI0003475A83|nr:J domain-containing protein [Pseudanabaena sp. PCC 6802]